jgi:nitrogenase molybdenum-iron protein beta chain
LQAVVSEFRDDGVAVIGAETGGFKGNSYHGYDLVLAALASDFIPRAAEKVAGQVNLWGIAPGMDPFWRGNLEGVRLLLERLGLVVNSFFTDADSLEGIRAAGAAELNIVVSDLYGREAARIFAERHAIPALTAPLPVGPSATSDFLHQVGAALGIEAAAETLIAAETTRYYQALEPLTDCWNDLDLQRYAVVVGDANYAPALTRFLASDLGWLPELTVCTDPLPEADQTLLAQRLDGLAPGFSSKLVFETDGSEVLGHLNRHWPPSSGSKYHHAFSPAFVVGSSLERELAQALGAAHLAVSFPVANRAVLDRGYTGYRGGLRLIEDLVSAIVAGR